MNISKIPTWLNIRQLKCLSVTLVLALIILYLNNYKYGIGDQIIHIPYIKHLLNNQMYATDGLIQLISSKPSYIWDILLPIYRLTGMEIGMFIVQILSLILFLYALMLFVKKVTKSSVAAFIAALFYVFPKYSFGYSSLFVYSHFIPRNLAIGLVIIALLLYISNKKFQSTVLLGLTGSLHILSVVPVIAAIFINEVIILTENRAESFRMKLKLFIKNNFGFFIGMLPLVIKYSGFITANSSTGAQSSVQYKDYFLAVLTPFYETGNENEKIMMLNAILMIFFSIVLLKRFRNIETRAKNFLSVLVSVSTILVIISIISEKVFPNPFIMQLQLGRSGQFALLVFTTLLAQTIVESRNKLYSIFLAGVAILFSNIAPLLLISKALSRRIITPVHYLIILALLTATYFMNYKQMDFYKHIKPSITLNAEESDNVQVQKWLRENTPLNATVLAPYYIGGFTEPDFRTISERTNVLTNADLVETILNTNLLDPTINKLNNITSGNYSKLTTNDNLFNYYVGRNLYHATISKNSDKLIQLYNVDYIVIEADYVIDNKILVYSNNKYKIYAAAR